MNEELTNMRTNAINNKLKKLTMQQYYDAERIKRMDEKMTKMDVDNFQKLIDDVESKIELVIKELAEIKEQIYYLPPNGGIGYKNAEEDYIKNKEKQ